APLPMPPIPLIPLSPQPANSSAPQAASPASELRMVFDMNMVCDLRTRCLVGANGKPTEGLTWGVFPSPTGDKTFSGTTTCVMSEISLIDRRRVLGSCDNCVLARADESLNKS